MKEKEIQKSVAELLDQADVLWAHIPNEAKTLSYIKNQKGDSVYFKMLSELNNQGVKSGVPDCLIFTTPPNREDKDGLALELKTKDGTVSDDQQKWVNRLAEENWLCAISYGLDDGIQKLEKAGYL